MVLRSKRDRIQFIQVIAADLKQLKRYALVGLLSNLAGYIAYLILTSLNLNPKLSMTLVYLTGATIGFLGNKNWTFSHRGGAIPVAVKYLVAHTFGYLVNFLILYFFVDKLMYPHQVVQAVAIVVVAIYLFVILKRVVFAASAQNI
jgi:putative flippase GtrA